MSTLAETIASALAAAGPATQDRLQDIITELGELNLGEEGRLAVLASAVAATAATYHTQHQAIYLEAVRTWALEISVGRGGLSPRFSGLSLEGAVEDGTEILMGGLEAMLEAMQQRGVPLQDRLATELTLFSRLLGAHEGKAIHLTLMAATAALAEKDYRPGETIDVSLCEAALPLARDACLAEIAPRGLA